MSHRSHNPQPEPAPVRVLSVPSTAPIVVRFLGGYRGLFFHWHGGRSYACQGVERCPNAVHRARTLWRAYAAVEGFNGQTRKWRPSCLEITESLEEFLRDRDIRGEVWYLVRDGERGKLGAVVGKQLEILNPETLPPAFDISPILKRLYHVATLPDHIPNPLPPRILLSESDGEAPMIPPELEQGGARTLSPQEWGSLAQRCAERGGVNRQLGTPSEKGKKASASEGGSAPANGQKPS